MAMFYTLAIWDSPVQLLLLLLCPVSLFIGVGIGVIGVLICQKIQKRDK